MIDIVMTPTEQELSDKWTINPAVPVTVKLSPMPICPQPTQAERTVEIFLKHFSFLG